MTTQEFSNTFDTLLNSYATQAVFGDQASKLDVVLDEYEKSVFLTQAQDIIVKQYFQTTTAGEGFDDSARRQTDFSSLITVENCTEKTETGNVVKYDERSILFQLPAYTKSSEDTTKYSTKVLFILNEKLVLLVNGVVKKQCVIVPINYREYDRQLSKAFSQPLKKQAWRLTQDDVQNTADLSSLYAEIIPNDAFVTAKTELSGVYNYKLRYVRRPKPIILTNLDQAYQDGLDIDGYTKVSECELNPILHMDILSKAVELALSTRGKITTKE
jgi:hypothetical protein